MSQKSPWFDRDQMDDALVSFHGFSEDYEETLEQGGPDIGVVTGAPNGYEGLTRYKAGESDVLHNLDYGNLPDAIIIPEEERELINDVQDLHEWGVEVLSPDYDLDTTEDDFRTPMDVASSGEKIHSYTSDYHGLKAHLTGLEMLDGSGIDLDTFGVETDPSRRRNMLRHNFFAQTADFLVKKYL